MPFLYLLIILLKWLPFYWACFKFKKYWEHHWDRQILSWSSHIVTGNFSLGFSLKSLSIFVDISGSTELITLIWVSLERSVPHAELECWWCQFWSTVMTLEVKQRSTLITAGYSQHRSQWVKEKNIDKTVLLKSDFTLLNADHFRVLEMLMWQNSMAK